MSLFPHCSLKLGCYSIFFPVFSFLPENPAQRRRKDTRADAGNTEPRTKSLHTDTKNVLSDISPAPVTVTLTATQTVTCRPPQILTPLLARVATSPRNATTTDQSPEITPHQTTAVLQTLSRIQNLLTKRDCPGKSGMKRSLNIVRASQHLSQVGRKAKNGRNLRQSTTRTDGKSPRSTRRKEAATHARSRRTGRREKTSWWWRCGKRCTDPKTPPAMTISINTCGKKSQTSTTAWSGSICKRVRKGWNVEGQKGTQWEVQSWSTREKRGGEIPSSPPVTVIKWDRGWWHTLSIAFQHLPPNSARFGYTAEGVFFISAQLSSNTVSALWKVRVLIWL